MRPKLPNLISSPVTSGKFQFRASLFHDPSRTREVNGLRDIYKGIGRIWDRVGPDLDEVAYQRTASKLSSLLDGLGRTPLAATANRVLGDYRTASTYARLGKFDHAVRHQANALFRIHGALETLSLQANRPSRFRNSSLDGKTAYGYDISGEVFEGSGEIANHENQKNINDTAQPQDHHETPPNPANLMRDVDADKEFPELLEQKNKRVIWPSRTQ